MKLSVLITYHNEGRWLTECLQSIVPQLAADDEVLIHDDASSERAEDFVLADTRARMLRSTTNIGPARARNELLAASRGTHVHFHDADDLFADTWREKVGAALATGVDVVFTDVAGFDDAGQSWHNVMGVSALNRTRDLLGHALRGGLLGNAGTYRREVVQRMGGYRNDLWQSEDYDFHIRLALEQPGWTVLEDDLVLIRHHGRQRSRKVREVWTCAVDALEKLAGEFPRDAYDDVAFAATRAGSALYASGAHEQAARAFALARRFGGARYDRRAMQRLTRLFGALPAEWLASTYRKVVPNALRARVQRSG
ncbi:MAG TPA: glycosyltransferase family 2 protein [Longimicrobiales bacterium]|nr:glycosyltransferase family 2 protein [Longimicrobiales bacterium]